MATPLDPTSVAFLMAESKSMPMHVAGLQLFEPPDDAADFARDTYRRFVEVDEVAPLFLRHPVRSLATVGQWVWKEDSQFDIEHHVRHSALPAPGRVRELLELTSRLHGTMLTRDRPLWESHVIEGLDDGRVAVYTKVHHALVDGISAMRLMRSVMTTDPSRRDVPAPWSADAGGGRSRTANEPRGLSDVPVDALRTALALSADAAGLPAALVRTLSRGARNKTSAVSFHAPRTMLNTRISGARRFAAQSWEIERMRTIGRASSTTLNDVVLAMCSGALRRYLIEHDALPDSTLVSMVPVGLNAKQSQVASTEGGNAVGSVMVRLATDLPDPADRLRTIHESMASGKRALATMTPLQILAMSAVGMAPSVITPMLRADGIVRPPFNLVISNVPGSREVLWSNGARLVGSYPVSIPIHGMALNITCTSYVDRMDFGLTGCRRSVPSLQRLLTHLDDELIALEEACGVG